MLPQILRANVGKCVEVFGWGMNISAETFLKGFILGGVGVPTVQTLIHFFRFRENIFGRIL